MPESEAEWERLLDELEAHTRGLGGGDPVLDWAPPAGIGPLPAALEQRVQAVLAAQRDAMARLADQQQEVGRHLSALRLIPERPATPPVYLDVDG